MLGAWKERPLSQHTLPGFKQAALVCACSPGLQTSRPSKTCELTQATPKAHPPSISGS